MADFNGRKGDFENAIKYIERALKLAEEVLDGIKVHQKYLKILITKSEILQKKRRFQEAI
jgi:tetratricopeptide (TPR) repeat protein